MDAVRSHIAFFSSLDSRVTGYPGCDSAAEYIRDFFTNLGLSNVSYLEFSMAAPIDYGVTFNLSGYPNVNVTLYMVEPNVLVPSTTPGITGPLVYGGTGSLEELDGKPINGSIVIMDYNSGLNWLNAVKFGAKAVIFIEPSETSLFESKQKSVDAPLHFPRYYFSKEDATELFSIMNMSSDLVYATIKSKMVWEQKNSRDVIGVLEGGERKDEIIILSAYYDDYSVVLSMAPGANEAVGIATLLETARLLKEFKPEYTIMFVAYSGHYQGLLGAKTFAQRYFLGEQSEVGRKIILQVHLQLSSESDVLATTNMGMILFGHMGFHPFKGEPFNDFDIFVVDHLIETINDDTDSSYNLVSATLRMGSAETNLGVYVWSTLERSWYPNDCSVLSLGLLGPGYSIITVDYHNYINSPIDTYENVNYGNLKHNVEATILVLHGIISVPNLKNEYLSDFFFTSAWEAAPVIEAQIVEYDEAAAKYTPLPHSIVYITAASAHAPGMRWPKFFHWTSIIDDEGKFYFPLANGPSASHPLIPLALDEESGTILYAFDMGIHSSGGKDLSGGDPGEPRNAGYISLFNCSTVILFDTFYPYSGSTNVERSMELMKHSTLTVLDSYNFEIMDYSNKGDSWTIAYVPPEIDIAIKIGTAYLGEIPVAFLTNATSDNVYGTGYRLKPGEQLIIYATSIEYAKHFYYINQKYISALEQTLGPQKNFRDRNRRVSELISLAEDRLNNWNYSGFYAFSIQAWREGHTVYTELRNTIYDIGNTTMFYSFILVPFSFLFEELCFAAKGKKKILSLLITFAIFIAFFAFVHPGISIADNGIMTVISAAVIILILPVLGVTFDQVMDSIKKVTIKISGVHFAEMSKASAVVLAFQTGIQNMKRRKLRSRLTLASVMLTIIGMVLFASMSSISVLKPRVIEGVTPSYQGIYLRTDDWSSVGINILDILKVKYSDRAAVLPRNWLWTIMPDSPEHCMFTLSFGDKTLKYYAISGLTPEDKIIDQAIDEGRSFIPGEEGVCILPSELAEEGGIKIGDEIFTLGRRLRVVGITNSTVLDRFITELDGEPITPWYQAPPALPTMHTHPSATLFVPFNFLRKYNPRLVTISIIPKDTNATEAIALDAFESFDFVNVYAGIDDKVIFYTRGISVLLFGWQYQIFPIALTALILLNTILGSVYERKKDIFIFSSIGMSPLHVSMMFLAEFTVYAIVGTILGYLLSLLLGKIVLYLFPAFTITANYSSKYTMLTLGIGIAIVIASSLYPAKQASKVVTPSYERVWKIPTKPKGDLWEIPVPFVSTSEEVTGVLNYLTEYINGHTGEAKIFSTLKLERTEKDGATGLLLETRLEPYEQGVRQKAEILFVKGEAGRFATSVSLARLEGPRPTWKIAVRFFVNEIRKQLLLWRVIPPEEREKYIRGER